MELSLHYWGDGKPDIIKFVEDHPELVEKVDESQGLAPMPR